MWDRVLRKSGFGGIDVEIHDCADEEFYNFSTIMSTAQPTVAARFDSDITIVTNGSSAPQSWIQGLQDGIEKITGAVPLVQDLESVDPDGRVCVLRW